MEYTEKELLEITRNVEEFIKKTDEERKEKFGVFYRLVIQNSNKETISFNSIDDLEMLKDIRDIFKDNIKDLVRYHADLKGEVYNADSTDYVTFYWYDDPQVNKQEIAEMIEEMERIIKRKEK